MDSKRALRQLEKLEHLEIKEMRLAAEAWDAEWKTLVATIMSAQSRDETTIVIATRLFERYPKVEDLANAKYSDVLEIFSGLNYNKTKAKNVIACAREIVERHGGKVPHDFSKLVELSGVGRKTANVFLTEYGQDGLAVDTHVFATARKLGWSDANTRDKVEMDLRKLFPQEVWRRVNPALVRFGKSHTSRKKKNEILNDVIKTVE